MLRVEGRRKEHSTRESEEHVRVMRDGGRVSSDFGLGLELCWVRETEVEPMISALSIQYYGKATLTNAICDKPFPKSASFGPGMTKWV